MNDSNKSKEHDTVKESLDTTAEGVLRMMNLIQDVIVILGCKDQTEMENEEWF